MTIKKLGLVLGVLSVLGLGTLANASNQQDPVVNQGETATGAVSANKAVASEEAKVVTSEASSAPVSSEEPKVISAGTSAQGNLQEPTAEVSSQ